MSLNKRFLTGGDFTRPPPQDTWQRQEPLLPLGSAGVSDAAPAFLRRAKGCLQGQSSDPHAAAARGHVGAQASAAAARELSARSPRLQRAGSAARAARWDAGSFRNRGPICLSCMPGRFFTTESPGKSRETFNNGHDCWGDTDSSRAEARKAAKHPTGTEEAPRTKKDPTQRVNSV